MRFITAGIPTVLLWGLMVTQSQAQSRSEDYRYDDLGRLEATVVVENGTAAEARSWCFDANGNRVEFSATSSSTVLTCAPSGVPPEPSDPTPPSEPPEEPDNIPPSIRRNIIISGYCGEQGYYPLSNIFTDPDDTNFIILLSRVGGGGTAFRQGSSLSINYGPSVGLTVYAITVMDSGQGSATGTFTIEAYGTCSGGGPGGPWIPPIIPGGPEQ